MFIFSNGSIYDIRHRISHHHKYTMEDPLFYQAGRYLS